MSRFQADKAFWLAALRADGTAFLSAVSEPEALPRQVPSCPEWSVGDLTRHLGGFYHRIRRHAGSTPVDEPWPPLGVPDDAEHVNPNGGAIALGHPLGMSGARLALTAALELGERKARRALCTMCIGVGQGISLALEAV